MSCTRGTRGKLMVNASVRLVYSIQSCANAGVDVVAINTDSTSGLSMATTSPREMTPDPITFWSLAPGRSASFGPPFVAIDLVAVGARVVELFADVNERLEVPCLRRSTRDPAGVRKRGDKRFPIRTIDRHRLAVLTEAPRCEQERRSFGDRQGSLIDRQPPAILRRSPLDVVERLRGDVLLGFLARIRHLHVEDDVGVRKRDRPHQLRKVSFRWRKCRARRSGGGSHWDAARLRKRRPREGTVVQLRLSCLELDGLENRRSKIDRLLPRQAARRRERHRLLDLVDETAERLRAPVREEGVPDKWRTTRAFHGRAMTLGALRLVGLQATNGLCGVVHSVGGRSRLT